MLYNFSAAQLRALCRLFRPIGMCISEHRKTVLCREMGEEGEGGRSIHTIGISLLQSIDTSGHDYL